MPHQPTTHQPDLPLLSRHLRALAYVLNLVRFSVLILIAGAGLLASGQGQDVLIGVGEDDHFGRLLLGITLWATSIWLWARVLLNIHLPSPPVDSVTLAPYRRWIPRLLGTLGFVVVALDAEAAGGEAEDLIIPIIILGAVFFAAVTWRRAMARKIARMRAGPLATDHWLWVEDQGGQTQVTGFWKAMNCGVGRFGLLMLITGTLLFIWGVTRPLAMADYFDTILLLFIWGATMLPLGSLLTYWGSLKGIPVLSLLLAAALLFSLTNDNHQIPQLAGATPSDRPHIDEALAAWETANCQNGDCPYFVVLATAGGGIRAGFWTGTVLGSLHESVPDFDHQLFAISGVSGGSMGATFYRAAALGGTGSCTQGFRDCLLNAIGKDYLTPLSVALLYPDLAQRFLPVPLMPDRGQALERAWARGFEDVYGRDTLNSSFAGLSNTQGRPWPALFLNATWSNSGGRLVASNLRFATPSNGNSAGMPFSPLPKDQLDIIGHDLRLASAAHNSARFPVVSPPGSWRDQDGKIAGRLQDGGLFENYGAETAIEILDHAKAVLGDKFRPLVIMISSDPELSTTLSDIEPAPVENFAAEALATVRTLLKTRVAHGDESAVWLESWARINQAPLAYFSMCPPVEGELEAEDIGTDPPLGWALSNRARRTIQGFLLDADQDGQTFPRCDPACRERNTQALEKVVTLLKGSQN